MNKLPVAELRPSQHIEREMFAGSAVFAGSLAMRPPSRHIFMPPERLSEVPRAKKQPSDMRIVGLDRQWDVLVQLD